MVLTIKFQAKDDGLRAVDALRKHYAFSNRRIKKIKFQGYFKLNGENCYLIVPVKAGDIAEICDDAQVNELELSADAASYIVYKDDWFIAANKPANMLTQPNYWHTDSALTKIISKQELHLVNRLDKDSSGLVILATSSHAHSVLTQISLAKYYLTLVYGDVEASNFGEEFVPEFKQKELQIEMEKGLLKELSLSDSANLTCNYCAYPICRREASILERRICLEKGKSCLTLFRKLAYDQTTNVSLVLCRLLTGRTHQIRLHFLSMGHPLLGESLYDLANLAEMARLPYEERTLSFKKEIPLAEKLELDSLRFTDNPLSTDIYIKYLANLLNIEPSKLQAQAKNNANFIKSTKAYQAMQILNASLPRQALHAWALSFANPVHFPNNSVLDYYVLFAPLQADMANFITEHFPKQKEILGKYEAFNLHYPKA